jgi:hypothetical protein
MHNSRLYALVGVGIGSMGLFLKTLTTAGEGLLPTLSQMAAAFPDGIPTIWGGLAMWAQVLLLLIVTAIVVIALRPNHELPMDRVEGAVVSVLGLALVGYSAQADIIPAAYSVNTSTGFVILLVGASLVVFGGVISLRREAILTR